jgi:hypothetical protein
MGYKVEGGNPINWVVLLIQEMKGPLQHEICTCCEPQGLQGWYVIGGGLSFSPILNVASWDYVHYFKDGGDNGGEKVEDDW